MAVDSPNVKLDPYQSQVPLVQLPPEQIGQTQPAQPLPGQFGGHHGTGALAIGDAILKGVLKGHAYKEEKKYKQAEATINAADKATDSAYANYQDALAQGKDGESVKALYDTYVQTFNMGKAAKAQFAIPDEKQKKSQQKGGVKGKLEQFGGGIKEFFEANPHVVPQIALMTMQPKPQGPSLETQATRLSMEAAKRADQTGNLKLEDEQRTAAAKKTYDLYSGLSPEEMAALPRETQQSFQEAKNVLYPPKESGTPKLYTSPDGEQIKWMVPGQEPQGWNAIPTGVGQSRPGTPGFYTEQYAKQNGLRVDQLTTKDLDYINQKLAWDRTQSGSSTSTRWVIDSSGNYTALPSTTTRSKGQPPPAPTGRQAIDFFRPQQQGLAAPPTSGQPAAAAPAAAQRSTPTPPASRGLSAPPTSSKVHAFSAATNTEHVETEKANRYRTAEDKFRKATATAKTALEKGTLDDAGFKAANEAAQRDLEKDKQQIGEWYAQQVHAVGGHTADDLPREAIPHLKAGHLTTFGNGQQWTLDQNGKPKRIK